MILSLDWCRGMLKKWSAWVFFTCLLALLIIMGLLVLKCFMRPMSENKNRLGVEKSPYLLQHKDNPVWWYAWGDEAIQAAKRENKPIFLSIGYATCHWCHVMEHESFEDANVADAMNQNFVSIKVDREERPDIDKIYMDAIVATTGHGGWPMSVFLDHELKPFYGGTYFPKEQFLRTLSGVSQAWKKDPKKIQEMGSQIVDYLKSEKISAGEKTPPTEKSLGLAFREAQSSFDTENGGFGHAPKFPPSGKLQVLLRIARRSKDKAISEKALHMVNHTLDQMARGGIYDHLGGGFHRYSTDERWLVPHFEKMLYDQASLVLIYLEAFQLTKKEMYREIVQETLDYVLRDMVSSEGGFYSAEDADSEGVEGKFYVWTEAELKKHLEPKEFEMFKKTYGVTEHGNFEDAFNILTLQKDYDWGVKSDPVMKKCSRILFSLREKRIRPLKDDKILTDWNGLMIYAMAKGYQIIRDEKYLKAAQRAAQFVQENLTHEKKLLKRYREGDAKHPATLDDYAYLIQGLMGLYESDFNPAWIQWANDLQKRQDELFWDEKDGTYFFTEKGVPHLIRRSKEVHDEARPNSNAISILNLLQLSAFFLNPEYHKRAEQMLSSVTDLVQKHPGAYSTLFLAMDYDLDRSKEVVLIGSKNDSEVKKILSFLYSEFLPNKVMILVQEKDAGNLPLTKNKVMIQNKPTAYICEDNACKLPVHDLQDVKKQLLDIQYIDL